MSAPAVLYGVDDFVQNDLPRRVADVVHLLNPHHLILRFQRFGHALTIRHLTDESFLHIHGSLFDIVKVLSQRTVRQEIVVQDSVMITDKRRARRLAVRARSGLADCSRPVAYK